MTGATTWEDAIAGAALLAVDPGGLGGAVVRALPGPVREGWIETLRALIGADRPCRRVPARIAEGRLLGGLDLTATLRAGRPVVERGILADADGGVLLIAMAERLEAEVTGLLTQALDRGEVVVERDGIAARHPARLAVVALDEGGEGEGPPPALMDRLALHLDLTGLSHRDITAEGHTPGDVDAARRRLAGTRVAGGVAEALVETAAALGIGSLRAPLLAVRAARIAAALAGRAEVDQGDAVLAARLVLAPRAVSLPAPPEEDPGGQEEKPDEAAEERTTPPDESRPLEERVLEATVAAIPQDLLERLQVARGHRARAGPAGRTAIKRRSRLRGRPIGVRAGTPGAGARLDVVETLRVAAPWQPLRRRDEGGARPGLRIRPSDFRIRRFEERAQTTAIFVVDASGSSALHRLAEAKGAVELLLAACYIRRDQVALIAFRGEGAELLLPPTRSPARAKRSLAALPGGGGTPLAAGIDGARDLAEAASRKGETPLVVVMTDGRANIAREGAPGRARAAADALAAAGSLRAAGITSLLVDTSPRPQAEAARLAEAMAATYLPLPHADAGVVSGAVQSMMGRGSRG